MLRPIWKGWISFGLVNVPVRLYNAVKKKTVNFHQLRQTDGCRIRLKKVCSADGKEVTGENIVKGFEMSPDRYVVITADELKTLHPKADRSINIDAFVKPDQIDPIFFEQSYYLIPDTGAAKTYALLLTAMRESGRVAIACFVLRSKEYLATLRPAGQLLGLSTMYFAEEIVPLEALDDLPETAVDPTKRELAMAQQLIESLVADFEPQKYHNEYYQRVMELIERKAAGQDIIVQPVVQEGAKVLDLMAALEASLAAVNKKSPAKDRRRQASAH